MRRTIEKTICLLLVLVLLCGMMPMPVFAEATGHSDENGVGTTYGEKTSAFSGKVISILSASTSTFAGYIPEADGFNLAHRARYPQANLLTDVNETWWMQVIQELDAKLGINDSWAGSRVLNTQDTNSGDLGPDAAMASLTRIQNLGANGTPDVILFFGAGNDMGGGVSVGSFDPATAPTEVDLTATKWATFADAYVAAIMRLQHFYPDSEILVMSTYAMPSYVTEAKLNTYGPVIKAICDHYGVKYLDLRNCGVTFDMLPDGVHPNAEGMDYITEAVVNTLTSAFEPEAGENTVYSVTHNLSGAKASRHYYKGISVGKAFEETVTADEVTVTMGGKDITASAYADGKISIANVTGDLVITAKGEFNADGHLQKLPAQVCAGTNLWKALTPENIYYTASGWGNTSAGTTWSITFPVKAGDRVWATSIGAYPENGSTANGVRVTWFDENGALASLDRNTVYNEFAKNGYITAPEGAVALNVPMTNNQDHYAAYILSAEHSYENGVCSICGNGRNGPIITKQPTDGKAKLGEQYCVTVEAEGVDLKYEWYGRDAGAAEWFKSSVTDNTYDDVMTQTRAGREVYCIITDAYGNSVTTDTVKLICVPSKNWEQWIQPVIMTTGTYPTYGGSTTGYYSKGQTFGGILYSSTFREGTDVLWNLNPSTYYSAVANPASLLYTVDNRGKVFNESAWAGSVCSTTALRACGYDYPYTTSEIQKSFREKTEHGIENLEFGDLLWVSGHTAGIVGVTVGADGQTTAVTVIEQAGYVRVFEVTAAEWDSYFASHWTTIYCGDFDKSLTAPEEYPQNHSIIFERGNNTYVTNTAKMLFYIPTANTVYLTKNGSTTQYATSSFPTQTINGTTVYDLASLFSGVGDYYFHTEENETDMCIKVIGDGNIAISGTTATLSGFSNGKLLGYRIVEILDDSASTVYDFYGAPDGYTSKAVELSFRELSSNTFAIENIPKNAAGWKLEVFYDTGYGWARFLSENVMYACKDGHTYENGVCTICGEKPSTLSGKTISILGASISTYAGASNGAAADTSNATIRNNVKYYPNTTIPEVGLNDTWWMQVAEDLDLRLLVNNAWSGSAILLERSGTVGAYVDRCVQLHDNTGDNAGEEPDIICIQMGFNDFSYGKATLGDANIDYAALITDDGYGTPSTTMEATAIMLDKITKRYPDAEVYMFNHFKRIGQSASDTALMESLNAAIETVCSHFGVTVVDLYTALTDPDHIGDGRLHPNCLGMDVISEAVKSAIVANTDYEVATHIVSFALDGVTADYGADKTVVHGDSFGVKLSDAGYDDLSVTVTMGGEDITASAYSGGSISIPSVTGNVVITAKSIHTPKDYRWEFNGTNLTGENTLTKTAGTTQNGVFSTTRYDLAVPVVLSHEMPWAVEWKAEGTWKNASGSGGRMFTTTPVNAEYNARYIFKSSTNGIIAMGEKTTTGSHNYGIALADHGIDWTALHTYRLENRIAADGSNMIYLLVDGKEIGPMNRYFVGTTDKKTTDNWLSGKDFVFPHMGTNSHGFNNCSIEYIQVWEGGHEHVYESVVTKPTCTEKGYTTYTCTVCGVSYVDSYVDVTGHSFGAWTANTAATCTTKGTERRDCSNCDHYETREVNAKGHMEVIDKAVAATCTTPGKTEGKHCSVCGTVLVKQETVAATGHSFGAWVTTTAATCTAKGVERRDCNNCDHYENREINAKGHTEVIDKAVAATCTTPGKTEGKHCSVCGTVLVKQETIPAKGHAWDAGKVTKEPTETSEGVKIFTCTACDQTKTEIIPVLGHTHKYTETITAPTCTDQGYSTFTCTCGHTYQGNFVEAPGHTEVIDRAVTPTCTTGGKAQGKHCSVCGRVLVKQEEIPALGHIYEDGNCTRCHEADPDYEKPTEPTEPEVPEITVIRIAGSGRVQTALESAKQLKNLLGVEKFQTMVVADARNFPDALSGSYLAAAAKAPILLYADGQTAVTDYIKENLASGGTVYILGGESSVPNTLTETLSGIHCERVSGSGRYGTSLNIIRKGDEIRGGHADKLLICTGASFADSLSASATGLPILLVNGTGNTIRDDHKAYLETLSGVNIYVIGGKNTVNDTMLNLFSAYDADGTVERVSGSGRAKTSVEVAKAFFPEAKAAALALSTNFPDGLSGGPVAYTLGAPLLLISEGQEVAAAGYVAERMIKTGYIFGGTSSVSDTAANKVFGK